MDFVGFYTALLASPPFISNARRFKSVPLRSDVMLWIQELNLFYKECEGDQVYIFKKS